MGKYLNSSLQKLHIWPILIIFTTFYYSSVVKDGWIGRRKLLAAGSILVLCTTLYTYIFGYIVERLPTLG